MAAKYIGDGEFIPGVPARDLTDDELEIYSEAIQAHLESTGRELYQIDSQSGRRRRRDDSGG